MTSPIFVIADEFLVFRSPHAAEVHLEPGNHDPEWWSMYDGEGRLLRWYKGQSAGHWFFASADAYRLEVASEDPRHALVLRAEMLYYLAHRDTKLEASLFSLPLNELGEKLVQVCGFTGNY